MLPNTKENLKKKGKKSLTVRYTFQDLKSATPQTQKSNLILRQSVTCDNPFRETRSSQLPPLT